MLSLSTRPTAYFFIKLKVLLSTEESRTKTTSYPLVLSVVVLILRVVGSTVVVVVVTEN